MEPIIIDPDGDSTIEGYEDVEVEGSDPPRTKREITASFRVSKWIMIRSSGYFADASSASWNGNNNEKQQFELVDEDPVALEILLHACHNNQWRIPKSLSLAQLLGISKLMHYTRIYEPLYFPSQIWRMELGDVSNYSHSTSVDWVCVSYHFGWEHEFNHFSQIIQCDFSIKLDFAAGGLDAVEERLRKDRVVFTDELRQLLRSCEVIYEDGGYCSQDCRDLHSGVAQRVKRELGLVQPEAIFKMPLHDVQHHFEFLANVCQRLNAPATRQLFRVPECDNDFFIAKLEPFYMHWLHRSQGLQLPSFSNHMQKG